MTKNEKEENLLRRLKIFSYFVSIPIGIITFIFLIWQNVSRTGEDESVIDNFIRIEWLFIVLIISLLAICFVHYKHIVKALKNQNNEIKGINDGLEKKYNKALVLYEQLEDDRKNEMEKLNKALQESEDSLKISDSMLKNVQGIRLKIYNKFIKYLDTYFEDRMFSDVMTEPSDLLTAMLKGVSEEIMSHFDKEGIDITANISYQSEYLNNGKWESITTLGDDFDPQKFHSKSTGSTFYYATQAEGLIFYPTKKQAIDDKKYAFTERENLLINYGEFPEGSILCYGFKVKSNKKRRRTKRITYIQAVLSMSTDIPFTPDEGKEARKEIELFLKDNMFIHYREKLKIELINFFIQKTNEKLRGKHGTKTLLEAQKAELAEIKERYELQITNLRKEVEELKKKISKPKKQ